MQIRRLEWIKNSGIFENYRWGSGLPDLGRINVIYGPNGSVKTSLARALDAARSVPNGFENLSIQVDEAGTRRSTNGEHALIFDRLHVFSEAYIQRSHDFSGDTEVEAVLTLGERTVEDEKRISELKVLIETTDSELTKAATASRYANKALDDEYTTIARGVVTALSRARGDYRSNGNYHKGKVKTRFAGSRTAWTLLTDKEKDTALATVNSDERQTVVGKSYSLTIRSELPGEASAALAASPVSVVLDTLKEHEEASSWVENGRRIHKGLDNCIFCGGDFTEDRKKQIELHFSDEVEEAQRITDALIREIKTAQASLQGLLGDGAIAGSLFDDLRDSFKMAHIQVKTQVDELDNWLQGLLDALEKSEPMFLHRSSTPSLRRRRSMAPRSSRL